MKIAIDYGHGIGRDRGAVGILKEEEMIDAIGPIIAAELVKQGHDVVLTRPAGNLSVGQSLRVRVSNANKSKADYFVSLHFNAFDRKANGCEVFAISEKGRKLASAVQTELVNLGFRDRGVKNGNHLFVVRRTNMPAILVEGCFCDSQTDCNLYEGKKMASAILEGLLAIFGKNDCEKD